MPLRSHKHLNKDEPAMRQGPHRHARGLWFYSQDLKMATNRGVNLSWTLQEVFIIAPFVPIDTPWYPDHCMALVHHYNLHPGPLTLHPGTLNSNS